MRSFRFASLTMLLLSAVICVLLTASSGGRAEGLVQSQDAVPGLKLRLECKYYLSHGARCVFDRSKTNCSRKLTLFARINSILCLKKVIERQCDPQECIESQKIRFAVEQLEPGFDCNYLAVERPSCVLIKGQCRRVKDFEPRYEDRQCFRLNLTGPCPAEQCEERSPKAPSVDENDQSRQVKIGPGELIPDSHCTYTAEVSQQCFTIHGKCKKVNRLVVHGDRQICPDFEYIELCTSPSLCHNDLGQRMPEVGRDIPDCKYFNPVTIQECQETDFGCRKQMKVSSKKAGLEPKCYNFIYWIACPEPCRDSDQSKHHPESTISNILRPCPSEECDDSPAPEIPIVDQDVSSATATIKSSRRSTGRWDHWNVGKENWTDYERALYDAEVPDEFREFAEATDDEMTESTTKLSCTYRTIEGPCHFQKVLHQNQEKLTCLYFEDHIEVNNGAIGCEPMIRSPKPCPLSECRKKCDETLPPWSPWGQCSVTCRSEDVDYVERSSAPFRTRRRFAGRKVRTGCKVFERSHCPDLPLCPRAKAFIGDEDDDYSQESLVRLATGGATHAPGVFRPASSTVPGTTTLVLICVFAILTVSGALGTVFAVYYYYF